MKLSPASLPVYLDHHATTPVDSRVLNAMIPLFTEKFGNPSNRQHSFGLEAFDAVEAARAQVATAIGATPAEIYWTGGATEAINLALSGLFLHKRSGFKRLVTAATEHSATLETARYLGRKGIEVTILPVDRKGRISLIELENALQAGETVVSLLHGNNEIGTLHPISEIGALTRKHKCLFHVDAVQTLGRVPIDVRAFQIDLLSLSGHKIYGPKGVGALFIRGGAPKIHLSPLIHGGSHENGLRAGTLNVPGIVGLGKAAEVIMSDQREEVLRLQTLRNRLQEGLLKEVPDAFISGDTENRLPHNLHIVVKGVEAEAVLMKLPDLAISTGSACLSQSRQPSHVMEAIYGEQAYELAPFRFGLGRFNSSAQIEYVISRFSSVIRELRGESAEEPAKTFKVPPAKTQDLTKGL